VRAATLAALLGGAMFATLACSGPGRSVELIKQDKRTEIIALWTQIRSWRLDAGMDLEPHPDSLLGVRGKSVKKAQLVCQAQVPTPCNDVCNLGDAICDNAERICDIAAELGPDDKLGVEKCESSKASCREAKQRCCSCAEKQKASATW